LFDVDLYAHKDYTDEIHFWDLLSKFQFQKIRIKNYKSYFSADNFVKNHRDLITIQTLVVWGKRKISLRPKTFKLDFVRSRSLSLTFFNIRRLSIRVPILPLEVADWTSLRLLEDLELLNTRHLGDREMISICDIPMLRRLSIKGYVGNVSSFGWKSFAEGINVDKLELELIDETHRNRISSSSIYYTIDENNKISPWPRIDGLFLTEGGWFNRWHFFRNDDKTVYMRVI
jgi:hypothetical protein